PILPPIASASTIDTEVDPLQERMQDVLHRGAPELVRQLYLVRGVRPLFVDDRGLTSRAGALLRALARADEQGLDVRGYRLPELVRALDEMRETGPAPRAAQLAQADVRLAQAFVSYGEDLLAGQLHPRAGDAAMSEDERGDTLPMLSRALDAPEL